MFNDNLMDWLSIFSIMLQLQVMAEQKQQSDNDDIMAELQKQDKEFFEKIILNQTLILEKLNRLTDKVD